MTGASSHVRSSRQTSMPAPVGKHEIEDDGLGRPCRGPRQGGLAVGGGLRVYPAPRKVVSRALRIWGSSSTTRTRAPFTVPNAAGTCAGGGESEGRPAAWRGIPPRTFGRRSPPRSAGGWRSPSPVPLHRRLPPAGRTARRPGPARREPMAGPLDGNAKDDLRRQPAETPIVTEFPQSAKRCALASRLTSARSDLRAESTSTEEGISAGQLDLDRRLDPSRRLQAPVR